MVEVILVCEEGRCPSAPRARQVLEAAAAAYPQASCRLAEEADRTWIQALRLMITPAFIVNRRLAYIGVPSQEKLLQLIAREMVEPTNPREAGQLRC